MTPIEHSERPAPARSAREQFDRQASHYDAQWNAWNEESLRWMLENCRHRQSDAVLDVATGTGFTALGFAPHVACVAGLDISSGMLEQARRRAEALDHSNVAFREGAAEYLPFPDADFDVVTCRVAAHHFLDVEKFAREAHRVLIPGGRLLIADTTAPDGDPEAARWQNEVEILRDPSHVGNYTPLEWRMIVERAGFQVDELSDIGGGITILLTDWMVKSGCDIGRQDELRRRFREAPASAKRAFRIMDDGAGETFFTWPRVVIRASRP